MKKYIDIFPKLTRISRAGRNERRIIGSLSFYDGNMIMLIAERKFLRSSNE